MKNIQYILCITTRAGVDKALPEPEKELEFEARDNKEYEINAIIKSAVYGQQTNNNNQILGLYYLVLWKGYPEEKNTWEPLSVVIHLRKLINTFYKEHSEKLIAISLSLDSAPPITRLTVPKEPKQKRSYPNKEANKRSKN